MGETRNKVEMFDGNGTGTEGSLKALARGL